MPLSRISRILGSSIPLLVAVAVTCAAGEWKRLSPFEALEIKGDAVHVRVAGAPYECLAIDGLTTTGILA